jgi:hypothetical protein
MTRDDLLDLLPTEVKGLSNYLVTEDYENAVTDASNETGWAFPITGSDATQTSFMEYWIKYRAKRHLFFYLMSESAHKFKYDVISLNQRFDHYALILKTMDAAWEKFMAENPELFFTGDAANWFCTKIDAGFAYNEVGEDITYDQNIQVIASGQE